MFSARLAIFGVGLFIVIGLPAVAQNTAMPSVADMVQSSQSTLPSTNQTPPAPAVVSAPVATLPASTAVPKTASIPSPAYLETLPIEVAMMYSKLLKEEPNFDFLVFANPAFREDPGKFSDPEAIKAERAALEKLYKSFTPETVFFAEKEKLEIELPDEPPQSIKLRGLEPDLPFIYGMTESDRYGLFIRNAQDSFDMVAPYEKVDWKALNELSEEDRTKLVAEVTLKPVASDRDPYKLEDETEVKIVLANLVELKLFTPDKSKLLMQKRFKNWKPYVPPPVAPPLIDPDALIPASPTP